MSNKQKDQHDQNKDTGRLAGIGAGALSGAVIGQALLPIPGVGAFAGAMVGGLLGSEVGKSVGGSILDTLNNRSGTPAAEPDSDDSLAKLERIAQLRAQGLLSEEEYQVMKKKILGL